MYAEADYIHPFLDGNSRTLRTFTRQIARESGYELDWEKFNRTEADRDLLYIARDRKVNELAKSFIQHENAMRKILFRQDQLNGYRSLHDLLDEALRPMSV
jgi:cell filamentation protein